MEENCFVKAFKFRLSGCGDGFVLHLAAGQTDEITVRMELFAGWRVFSSGKILFNCDSRFE